MGTHMIKSFFVFVPWHIEQNLVPSSNWFRLRSETEEEEEEKSSSTTGKRVEMEKNSVFAEWRPRGKEEEGKDTSNF